MTTLRHPLIEPAHYIEVPDEAVESHLAAGWLLPDEGEHLTPTDPDHPGEDLDTSEESNA